MSDDKNNPIMLNIDNTITKEVIETFNTEFNKILEKQYNKNPTLWLKVNKIKGNVKDCINCLAPIVIDTGKEKYCDHCFKLKYF